MYRKISRTPLCAASSAVRRGKTGLLLALIILTAGSLSVVADSEGGLRQYTMETADGKFVFVMLAGGDRENPSIDDSSEFKQSGLFNNDGSTAPLWTVDWAGQALPSSDGRHLVRQGAWSRTREGYCSDAIAFYDRGRLLKEYRVCDLVMLPWLLPHSSSHFEWLKVVESDRGNARWILKPLHGGEYEINPGVVMDDENHTLSLATLQGDEYVFDLDTGSVVQSSRPVRSGVLVFTTVFVVGYTGYLLYRVRGRGRSLGECLKSFGKIVPLLFVVVVAGALLIEIWISRASERPRPLVIALWRGVIYPPIYAAEMMDLTGWPYPHEETVRLGVAGLFWVLVVLALVILNNRIQWLLSSVITRKASKVA